MTSLTAQDWPIAAACLPFANATADGVAMDDAPVSEWAGVLTDIAEAGFDAVDLTDSWLRVADLSAGRRDELAAAARDAGVRPLSISLVRRSVIDAHEGADNLAYSHRAIDAAAALGVGTVSVGLHQALTAEQKRRLWFWTTSGHVDDPELWECAVERLRELGRHAADVGVLLSLEMYEDTLLGTADSAVRLVEQIGFAEVGLNPDLGNLVRSPGAIEDWKQLATTTLPYANFWHVKNYFRGEHADGGSFVAIPAPMRDGVLDYRWLVRQAIADGFQGVFCMEHYGGDGLSVSAANRDYLRTVLPRRPGAVGTSRVRQPSAEHADERGVRP